MQKRRRGEPREDASEPRFQPDFATVLLSLVVAILLVWMFADFWLH